MVTSLDRKLIRDLYHSKGLLLAITSIIAVGVMCFVAMQSAYRNLDSAKRRYYRQCRMADFWIELKKAPVSEVARIESIPGVVEHHSRIRFQATVVLEDRARPINALVLSLPAIRSRTLNDVVVMQGDYFTPRRRNEIIVNEAFARRHDLYPGRWIRLLLNDRREDFLIVGTAISSEFTYVLGPGALIPDPDNFGVFYIKREFAEEVFDFSGATNQVIGRLAPEHSTHPEATLRRMESLLAPFGVVDATALERQSSNYFLSNEISGLAAYASIVPTIFMTVAALVLNVLINRLARRQRTIVGTLKAIGYSDGRIFVHFLLIGVSVGIGGGIVGGLLGYACATSMTEIYRQYFEFPDLRSEVYWRTYLIGMLVSLTCSVAGTMQGARSMLKLDPAAAMRPAPPRKGGAIWLERLGPWWRRLSPSWRLALRSVVRHRQRTAVGLFAACMGAGLLVNGFMMAEAQDFLLDFQFKRVLRSDVDLGFDQHLGSEALDEVRRLPGVDYVEPLLDVPGTLVNGPYRQKGAVTGIVKNARLTTPRDRSGRPMFIPQSGVVMTKRLAHKLRLRAGDRVRLDPSIGARRPVELTVVAVADSYLGLSCYADIGYLSRLVDEEFVASGAQLTIDRDPSHRDAMYRRLAEMPGIQSITSREELTRKLEETLLDNQYVFIGFLVGFAGIIFFGSIVNASMVSLAERLNEVATFRAVGYGPWRIGAMFLKENLLVNLFGALLGAPVGYGLMWLTALGFNNDLMRIPVVTAPWIWVATWLLTLLFALTAHAVVQWRIHRLDFLSALKVME